VLAELTQEVGETGLAKEDTWERAHVFNGYGLKIGNSWASATCGAWVGSKTFRSARGQ
jgi:hypothetical protein